MYVSSVAPSPLYAEPPPPIYVEEAPPPPPVYVRSLPPTPYAYAPAPAPISAPLYGGYAPRRWSRPELRPSCVMSPAAFPVYSPRISPRATFTPRNSSRNSSSTRRPLSSVTAYREAGLDPQAWPLTPSASSRIESWRSLPKYEEQMLLGHLKSQKANLAPPPPWTMKKFQNVRPRI